MKKRIIGLLLTLAILFSFAGCNSSESSGKTKITMYLWDKSMSRQLTPWLEKEFPDIDFTFVVGYNSMDFYTDLNSRGSLPDIITCRRFSLNDAAHMSDLLMDLSETDIVGSFYDSYIDNNREPGGAVRWLPMCAEVDGYVANVDLFEQNGIEIPTNYAEFADACRKFEELGIRCYVNDYREDYSCMEALQGCAIPELMTMAGTMWRRSYENEAVDCEVGLDDKVWHRVFEKFEQYMKDTRIRPEDTEMSFMDMKTAIIEGKAAIMRATANDCAVLRSDKGLNTVMLPYFGETSDDNWLLTYPYCQVAVNKAVGEDKNKTEAVMRVLGAMFSEDGQRRAAVDSAVLSYNKNVDIELSDVFSRVTDCIGKNHLYMRLASTEMFAVSKDVVQKMIHGEYGAKEAYEDFDRQLTSSGSKEAPEIAAVQKTAYSYDFGEHGSPAASAVLNTLRKQYGSEIAVGYSSLIAAPVFAGDYTSQQLNRLLANRLELKSGTLTGAELRELMEWLVNVKEDGSNPIRHANLIPAVSGMDYTITDNGDGTYTLGEIRVNGAPLDESMSYSVMTVGDSNYIEAYFYCNCPMPENLKEKMEATDVNVYTMFREALKVGNQLEASTEYITVIR